MFFYQKFLEPISFLFKNPLVKPYFSLNFFFHPLQGNFSGFLIPSSNGKDWLSFARLCLVSTSFTKHSTFTVFHEFPICVTATSNKNTVSLYFLRKVQTEIVRDFLICSCYCSYLKSTLEYFLVETYRSLLFRIIDIIFYFASIISSSCVARLN